MVSKLRECALLFYLSSYIRSWCLTCETLVKPTCLEASHQTRSLLEEAEGCQTELDEMLEVYEKEDAIRGRVDGVLQAKLNVILSQITENKNGRQNIQSAIATCQEIAKLPSGMKASVITQKKIE